MTLGGPGLRNLIHLATGVLAFWVLEAPHQWAVSGLASLLVLALALDACRLHPVLRRTLETSLPGVYRPAEEKRVSGASLLVAGYLLATVLFPAPAAAGGILALAVGDPAAALVGRKFGRRPDRRGKTWAGSVACFTAAMVVIYSLPGFDLMAAVAGAAMAALIERRAGPLDNLLVPVGVAVLLNLWLP